MRSNSKVPVGIVGLGLMGTSIAACILAHGHSVRGIVLHGTSKAVIRRRVLRYLVELKEEGFLNGDPHRIARRLELSNQHAALAGCPLVIESITESLEAKRKAIRQIEDATGSGAVIASNTSAIPISLLQRSAVHPSRVLGLHWAEPAHLTRFMEVICGEKTSPRHAVYIRNLARTWNKQPVIVRKDIRGFVANRIMYAMMREAFHLVEAGVASVAEVDRSVRNDCGCWLTLAGPFRIMDLTGIPAYATVMKDLLPELSSQKKVPRLLSKLVRAGARGIANRRGFYSYSRREASRWERGFRKFSADIRRLSANYDALETQA